MKDRFFPLLSSSDSILVQTRQCLFGLRVQARTKIIAHVKGPESTFGNFIRADPTACGMENRYALVIIIFNQFRYLSIVRVFYISKGLANAAC